MPYELISVLGPTATGKTRIAVQLANDFNGEVISADSRQVYKGMDIGTGKDLYEFIKLNVRYHLIDIIDPKEEYNLFRFTKDFKVVLDSIKSKSKLPILAGGSGLYLSAVLQSYNLPAISKAVESERLNDLSDDQLKEELLKIKPNLHNKTDLTDRSRILHALQIEKSRSENKNEIGSISSLNIGIKLDRAEIKKRITERLKLRFEQGMIDEVKELLNRGVTCEKLDYFGLEYRYIGRFISGKMNYNDMFQKLNSAIHNFAKKQMTWFRKMEREGVKINWFSPDDYSSINIFVKQKLDEE